MPIIQMTEVNFYDLLEDGKIGQTRRLSAEEIRQLLKRMHPDAPVITFALFDQFKQLLSRIRLGHPLSLWHPFPIRLARCHVIFILFILFLNGVAVALLLRTAQ